MKNIKNIKSNILAAVDQLERKKNIRLIELLPEVRNMIDDPKRIIDLQMSNSGKPPGANAFNESVWDTEIIINGKVTSLNKLLRELKR